MKRERERGREKSKESVLTVLQALPHRLAFPLWLIAKSWNTKAGKGGLFKNYLIHSLENHDCQLQQNTQQDTENRSHCLTVSISQFHTLSCSSTLYNLHLISISKIISLWVMHRRRSGEFVITWLWNRGKSASPCKTHFRVGGRRFAQNSEHMACKSVNIAGCT